MTNHRGHTDIMRINRDELLALVAGRMKIGPRMEVGSYMGPGGPWCQWTREINGTQYRFRLRGHAGSATAIVHRDTPTNSAFGPAVRRVEVHRISVRALGAIDAGASVVRSWS